MENIPASWNPQNSYALSTFRDVTPRSVDSCRKRVSRSASIFNPVCGTCHIPIDYYRREISFPIEKCKSCRSKMWTIRTWGNPHNFRVVEFELSISAPFDRVIRYIGHYCDNSVGNITMRILTGLLPLQVATNAELALLYTDQLRKLFQDGGIAEYAGHHSVSGRCAASLTIAVELWDNKSSDIVPEPGFVKVVK